LPSMEAAAARQRVAVALHGGRLHHAEQTWPASRPRHSRTPASSGPPGRSLSAYGRRGWPQIRPALPVFVPHLQAGLPTPSRPICCSRTGALLWEELFGSPADGGHVQRRFHPAADDHIRRDGMRPAARISLPHGPTTERRPCPDLAAGRREAAAVPCVRRRGSAI
jgi:hypothetical protein